CCGGVRGERTGNCEGGLPHGAIDGDGAALSPPVAAPSGGALHFLTDLVGRRVVHRRNGEELYDVAEVVVWIRPFLAPAVGFPWFLVDRQKLCVCVRFVLVSSMYACLIHGTSVVLLNL
ncbi:unnamed protein product, partial [Urochloa humidicola]